MASKANKEKAQKLVDEASELLERVRAELENKTQLALQVLELMNEAIALDETNDNAWSNRGFAKHALGDHQGAIDDCSEAIRLNPKNSTAWNNRGIAKDSLGDHQGAIDDFTKVIELTPENDSAWVMRGIVKGRLGHYESAFDDFTQAIKLNPKNGSAWNSRGLTKHKLGDHQGAIADYTKAIELNPKDDTAWSNRGAAKNALGDHRGAIDDCNEAIRLDPKNDAAWGNRGAAKGAQGDHQGAIDDCTKAIELYPKNDAAWNNRGRARYSLKQYEEAIKDYDGALRLNPDDKTTQKNRFAAGIALSSGASTTSASEKRSNIIGALKTSIDEQKNRSKWLRWYQRALLFILFLIIFGGLFALLVSSHLDFIGLKITSDPLSILPIFSILGFIIMPIIWGLRITGQAIMQASILEQDYFSRLNVMNSLEYYKSDLDDNNRNDLIIAYMENWMNDNTADRMERLYSKKSDAGKTPHEDVMKLCEQMIDKCMKKAGNAAKTDTK
jgi:tetratricopeptide (TPR) repeat protein